MITLLSNRSNKLEVTPDSIINEILDLSFSSIKTLSLSKQKDIKEPEAIISNRRDVLDNFAHLIGLLSEFKLENVANRFKEELDRTIENGNNNESIALMSGIRYIKLNYTNTTELQRTKNFIIHLNNILNSKKTKSDMIGACCKLIGDILIPLTDKKESENVDYKDFRNFVTELYHSGKKIWKKMKDPVPGIIMEVGILCNGNKDFLSQQPFSVFERLSKLTKNFDKNRSTVLDGTFYLLLTILLKYEKPEEELGFDLILEKIKCEMFPTTSKKLVIPQIDCVHVFVDIANLLSLYKFDWTIQMILQLIQQSGNELNLERITMTLKLFCIISDRIGFTFDNTIIVDESIYSAAFSSRKDALLRYIQLKNPQTNLSDQIILQFRNYLDVQLLYIDNQIGDLLQYNIVNKSSSFSSSSSSSSDSQLIDKEKQSYCQLFRVLLSCFRRILPSMDVYRLFTVLCKYSIHIDKDICKDIKEYLIGIIRTRPKYRSTIVECYAKFILTIPDLSTLYLHRSIEILLELLNTWYDPNIIHLIEDDDLLYMNATPLPHPSTSTNPSTTTTASPSTGRTNTPKSALSPGITRRGAQGHVSDIPSTTGSSMTSSMNDEGESSSSAATSQATTSTRRGPAPMLNKNQSLQSTTNLTATLSDLNLTFPANILEAVSLLLLSNRNSAIRSDGYQLLETARIINESLSREFCERTPRVMMIIQENEKLIQSRSEVDYSDYSSLTTDIQRTNASTSSTSLSSTTSILAALGSLNAGAGSSSSNTASSMGMNSNQSSSSNINNIVSNIQMLNSNNQGMSNSSASSSSSSAKKSTYHNLLHMFTSINIDDQQRLITRCLGEICKIIYPNCQLMLSTTFQFAYEKLENINNVILSAKRVDTPGLMDNLIFWRNYIVLLVSSSSDNHSTQIDSLFKKILPALHSPVSVIRDNLQYALQFCCKHSLYQLSDYLLIDNRKPTTRGAFGSIGNDLYKLEVSNIFQMIASRFDNITILSNNKFIDRLWFFMDELITLLSSNQSSNQSEIQSAQQQVQLSYNLFRTSSLLFELLRKKSSTSLVQVVGGTSIEFKEALFNIAIKRCGFGIWKNEYKLKEQKYKEYFNVGGLGSGNTQSGSNSSNSSTTGGNTSTSAALSSMGGSSGSILMNSTNNERLNQCEYELLCVQYWALRTINEIFQYEVKDFVNQEIFSEIGPVLSIISDVFENHTFNSNNLYEKKLIQYSIELLKSLIDNNPTHQENLMYLCIDKSYFENKKIAEGYYSVLAKVIKSQIDIPYTLTIILILSLFKLSDDSLITRKNACELLNHLSIRYFKNSSETFKLSRNVSVFDIYYKQLKDITKTFSKYHPELCYDVLPEIHYRISNFQNSDSQQKMLMILISWFSEMNLFEFNKNLLLILQFNFVITLKFSSHPFMEKLWKNNIKIDENNLKIILAFMIEYFHIKQNYLFLDVCKKICTYLLRSAPRLMAKLLTKLLLKDDIQCKEFITHQFATFSSSNVNNDNHPVNNNNPSTNNTNPPSTSTKNKSKKELTTSIISSAINELLIQIGASSGNILTQKELNSSPTTFGNNYILSSDWNFDIVFPTEKQNSPISISSFSFILITDLIAENYSVFLDYVPFILQNIVIHMDSTHHVIYSHAKKLLENISFSHLVAQHPSLLSHNNVDESSVQNPNYLPKEEIIAKYGSEKNYYTIINYKQLNSITVLAFNKLKQIIDDSNVLPLWNSESVSNVTQLYQLQSAEMLSNIVHLILEIFSCEKERLKEEWSKIALEWSVSLESGDQIVSRSFQIYRSLSQSLSKSVLNKIINKLLHSVKTRSPVNIQTSMEILETLRIGVKNTGKEILQDLPELFWVSVAMLHSIIPTEFSCAVNLVSIIVDQMNIQDDVILKSITKITPQHWNPAFEGIFVPLLKGVCSRKTEAVTRNLFKKLSNLRCSHLLHTDQSLRFLIPLLTLLPQLISCTGRDDSLEIAIHLADCFTIIDNGDFIDLFAFYPNSINSPDGMKSFVQRVAELISKYYFPKYIIFTFSLLVETMNNGPPIHERSILVLLRELLKHIDLLNTPLNTTYLTLFGPITKHLESQYWREGMSVLEVLLQNNSNDQLIQPSTNNDSILDNIQIEVHTWERFTNIEPLIAALVEVLNPSDNIHFSDFTPSEQKCSASSSSLKMSRDSMNLGVFRQHSGLANNNNPSSSSSSSTNSSTSTSSSAPSSQASKSLSNTTGSVPAAAKKSPSTPPSRPISQASPTPQIKPPTTSNQFSSPLVPRPSPQTDLTTPTSRPITRHGTVSLGASRSNYQESQKKLQGSSSSDLHRDSSSPKRPPPPCPPKRQ